jgi:hypothetical protein
MLCKPWKPYKPNMDEQSRQLRCNQVQPSTELLPIDRSWIDGGMGAATQYRVHAAYRLDHIKGDEEYTETIGSRQSVKHQED